VYIFDKIDYLCNVKGFYLFVEFLDVGLDEVDELSSFAELEDKVETLLVLERGAQFNDSGVFEVGEQFSFNHRLVLLLLLLQFLLLDLLHRVCFPVAIFDDQKHISVGAFS
jgi:hypothetical protein